MVCMEEAEPLNKKRLSRINVNNKVTYQFHSGSLPAKSWWDLMYRVTNGFYHNNFSPALAKTLCHSIRNCSLTCYKYYYISQLGKAKLHHCSSVIKDLHDTSLMLRAYSWQEANAGKFLIDFRHYALSFLLQMVHQILDDSITLTKYPAPLWEHITLKRKVKTSTVYGPNIAQSWIFNIDHFNVNSRPFKFRWADYIRVGCIHVP